MSLITIEMDSSQVVRLADLFKQIGNQKQTAIRRAVNWTGDRIHTRTLRVLSRQMGTTQKSIRKYIVKKPAFAGQLAQYSIIAKAPAMSLKEFKPKQTAEGIEAGAWGRRHVYPRTFFGPGGHVFVRAGNKRIMASGRYAGKLRQPIRKVWGPVLANELVRGESKIDFELAVQTLLPGRIEHEIMAILNNYAPKR